MYIILSNIENDTAFTYIDRILVEDEDQLLSLDRDGGGEPLAISLADLLAGGNGVGSANHAMGDPYMVMTDVVLEGASFFLNDHLGNTRVVFNKNYCQQQGDPFEIESAMDYYPFGKTLREYHFGGIEKYQTTQHERDGETELDYRGARLYDSDIGRFFIR